MIHGQEDIWDNDGNYWFLALWSTSSIVGILNLSKSWPINSFLPITHLCSRRDFCAIDLWWVIIGLNIFFLPLKFIGPWWLSAGVSSITTSEPSFGAWSIYAVRPCTKFLRYSIVYQVMKYPMSRAGHWYRRIGFFNGIHHTSLCKVVAAYCMSQ